MCIALVDKNRQLEVRGEFQLLCERRFLVRARRVIAVEVEPCFSHGDHGIRGGELLEGVQHAGIEVSCDVGMYPRGRVEVTRIRLGERFRLDALPGAGAGDNQRVHAGLTSPLQYRVAVLVKRFVGQVCTDIHQAHGDSPVHTSVAGIMAAGARLGEG